MQNESSHRTNMNEMFSLLNVARIVDDWHGAYTLVRARQRTTLQITKLNQAMLSERKHRENKMTQMESKNCNTELMWKMDYLSYVDKQPEQDLFVCFHLQSLGCPKETFEGNLHYVEEGM